MLDHVGNRDPATHIEHQAPLHFRPATRADLAALAELEAEVYVLEGPWTLEDYQEDFAEAGRCYLVVEDRSGALVGYAIAALEDDVAHIIAITVAEAHRRRGVARTLLSLLLDWARHTDAVDAMLEVRDGNDQALALYLGAGFVHAGRLEDLYSPGVHGFSMRLAIA